jgi:hypothetical protein
MISPASSRGLTFLITVSCVLGCTKSSGSGSKVNADQTPEDVYRQFFLATLKPDEHTIRKLIVDHKDADVLWKEGSYPEGVATLLASQYRDMTIDRAKTTANSSEPDRVLLQSSASPIPLTLIRRDGKWRLDAGPIVEMRKKAREIREWTEGTK